MQSSTLFSRGLFFYIIIKVLFSMNKITKISVNLSIKFKSISNEGLRNVSLKTLIRPNSQSFYFLSIYVDMDTFLHKR